MGLRDHYRGCRRWRGRWRGLLSHDLGRFQTNRRDGVGERVGLYLGERGLLGALFLICCRGFISFSHSARPEMVYAAFCGLAMLALALSDKWERAEATRRRARWTAYAAWLAMGLASVTKGPQLPLAIVLGQVIGLWATGERGRILPA